MFKMASDAAKRVLSIVEEVVEELERCGELVLEAYPGFGKTLLGVELLKRFRRGVMVVRTRMEMSVVSSMARDLGLRVAPLYGRYALCVKELDVDPAVFPSICRAMRVAGQCVERVDRLVVSKCSSASSPEELKAVGKELGCCVFRAHLVYAFSTGKIVTTYEFLHRHPEVVEELSRWDVAILDECHAIFEDLENLVVRVDRDYLWALAEALKRVSPRLCYALRSVYRKWGSLSDVMEALEKVASECGDDCPEIVELVERWRRGLAYVDPSTDAIYVATEPRISVARARLFATAYLPPPLARGRKVLRVSDPPIRVGVSIDTSISTRFRERGSDFIDRLAEAVANHIDRSVANLVVAPSKSIAEELARILALKGFRIAPPEAIDRVGEGTVIVDVAGGRATEGVTPSKSLRKVIVAGMPYPPPSPELNALAKLFGFDATYTYRALLKTVQALGRLMRWGGRGVLIDRRFAKFVDKLPSWIVVEEVC